MGTSKVSEAAGARWRFYRRIWSDLVGYPRIIVESSFYWRKHSGSFRWNLELQDFVAGAVFGEVGGWLYCLHALEMRFHMCTDHWWHSFCVAGAVFGELRVTYLLHALEMRFHMWRRSLMTFILRARRSIWWGCRVPLLAPRIGNDVWYVLQITGDIHFVWQAQQLVKLEAALVAPRIGKWRFICDTDHWMTCILRGRRSIWWGCRVPVLAPRIGNDVLVLCSTE